MSDNFTTTDDTSNQGGLGVVDQFTTTTNISYGDRVSRSSGGIVMGLLLFIGGFPLLWWNEGNSLHRIQTLDAGRKLVVTVPVNKVNPANRDKLIYTTGNVTTGEILKDNLFGVSINALKLNRIMEIYQWQESENTESRSNFGGSKTETMTYSYKKAWVPNLIDSSKFKHPAGHVNIGSMLYNSQLFTAQNIKFGAFKLADDLVSQITWSAPYPLTAQNIATMDNKLKSTYKLNNGEYYYGNDPSNPQVGDIRVHYTAVQPCEISVVGKQHNGQINAYYTHRGNISLLERGAVPVDLMFDDAESDNSTRTWGFRAGSFFLMLMGLAMVVRPISVIAQFVPLLGDIVNAGLGIFAGMIALTCSIITIGIAWISYRPLIGGSLLGIALFIFSGGIGLMMKRKKVIKTNTVQTQSSVVSR